MPDPLRQDLLYARVKLNASASSSLFPSATNSRWNLTAAAFGWSAASISSTFQLVEVDANASAVIFQWQATTTMGFCTFYLGPNGIQASVTSSQLKLLSGRADQVSLTGLFAGYRTG